MSFTSVTLPPLKVDLSPNRSSRHGTKVDTVVVHDTEGGYEGAVSWLQNPKADASAHGVLREDGGEFTQLVPWDEKAWACVAYNSRSDNIELAGFASKLYPVKQLRKAARIVAFRLKKRGLKPVRKVGGGWCYHSDLGADGGGHHDPGFSLAQHVLFTALVKFEFYKGGFRKTWGVGDA